jgi:hypothetical protein
VHGLSQAWEAWDYDQDDAIWRGIEYSSPKFVKDVMKAIRYTSDGARNTRGDVIMDSDEMSWNVLMTQAIGFSPAELNTRYEQNQVIRNEMYTVDRRRKKLLGMMYTAVRNQDSSQKQRALQKIRSYNAKYPFFPIDRDVILRSLKSHSRYSMESTKGLHIRKNMRILAKRLKYTD